MNFKVIDVCKIVDRLTDEISLEGLEGKKKKPKPN